MRSWHPNLSFLAKMKGEPLVHNEMLTLFGDRGAASIAGERLDVQGEAPALAAWPGWSFGLHLGPKTPAGGFHGSFLALSFTISDQKFAASSAMTVSPPVLMRTRCMAVAGSWRAI